MPPRKREPLARLPDLTPVGASSPIPPQLPTATEERREREWEELVDEIGTDGRIRVWHVIEGRSAFAGDMSPDTFSLDVLLDTYGGGEKALVFYQGKKKVETLRVSLDPSIPPRNPRSGRTGAAAVAVPGQQTGLGDLATMLTTMATMNMQSVQQSQSMMASMVTAMTALMSARPEKDPLDMAVKIAELSKANGGGGSSVTDAFTILEKGITMGKTLGGNNDEDGTLALAREGLGVVAKIIENQGAQVRVRPQGSQATLPRHAPTVGQGNGGVPLRGDSGVGGPGARGEGGQGSPTQGDGQPSHSDASGGEVGNGVDRLWVRAARPSAALLLLSIGNVEPATAAQVIADRLQESEFADLLDDVEQGTPAEFIERFQGYFSLEPFGDDTARWMLACVQAIVDMVEPYDGSTDSDIVVTDELTEPNAGGTHSA